MHPLAEELDVGLWASVGAGHSAVDNGPSCLVEINNERHVRY